MLEAITAKITGKAQKMSGGELVARMLAKEGVEKVFGIGDGTYLGLLVGLRTCGIELITPRHETCAAHMAGGYARVSGKLGVCIASNGPGVANILPGVVVEHAEGNRVLLITSARRSGTIDPDRGGTYQSFPQVEVTAPTTKWSVRVPGVDRLAEIMRKAFRISFSGRPGVVHVDIPESIMNPKHDLDIAAILEPSMYRATEPLAPSASQVERAANMLVAAECPMIHAGSGVLHAKAHAALAKVAELLHAPVTTSWAARGATSELPSYAVPMIYVGLNNDVRNKADCALVLGSRLGETDWWGKAPYWAPASKQSMIQVDIDEQTIGNNRPVDLAVVADVKAFLEALIPALEARKAKIDVAARRKTLAWVQDERAKERAKLDKQLEHRGPPMGSAHVGVIAQKLMRDDAIVVLDGGNTAIWGCFFTEVRTPGPVLATWKMGMLGAGIPQALGAKVAAPGRQVYCVIGDGAMGFHPQEIETAVRHKLDVIYMVLCDKQWGMVKINQSFNLKPLKTLAFGSLNPDETIGTELGEIEFDKLAKSMGAHGERVSTPEALEAAIKRCQAVGGPAVIHVDVDPVKHMWAPALKTFKDMHGEPGGTYQGSC